MIWIYKFHDGYILEKDDSLTSIELESLMQIHGWVMIDIRKR